jgi:hypothetical protein
VRSEELAELHRKWDRALKTKSEVPNMKLRIAATCEQLSSNIMVNEGALLVRMSQRRQRRRQLQPTKK